MEDTGYFIDSQKRIIGPRGPTTFQLNEENELFDEGKMTDIYIKDGHFFRCETRFWFFGRCSRTGHQCDSSGKIFGSRKKMPWS